jgi:hypothetical protein
LRDVPTEGATQNVIFSQKWRRHDEAVSTVTAALLRRRALLSVIMATDDSGSSLIYTAHVFNEGGVFAFLQHDYIVILRVQKGKET